MWRGCGAVWVERRVDSGRKLKERYVIIDYREKWENLVQWYEAVGEARPEEECEEECEEALEAALEVAAVDLAEAEVEMMAGEGEERASVDEAREEAAQEREAARRW